MKLVNFLKNPKGFISNKANEIAENRIRNQNFIPITETNDNDIFIAGFPKSGNTWMQNLISSLLLETTSQRLTPRLVNEIVPDVHTKQYYKRFFPVMFFKTHDLPKLQYKKVIHLVRDGRDVMVSYHKMGINQNKDFPYSLNDMIIEGKGIFPSKWYIHARKWLENEYNADIITVRYEDLLENPLTELKKICDFSNIMTDKENLVKIIKGNNIEKLRNKVNKYGIDNDHKFKNKKVTSFFRKGVSGSYKEEMNKELIFYFNNEAQKELLEFNYTI